MSYRACHAPCMLSCQGSPEMCPLNVMRFVWDFLRRALIVNRCGLRIRHQRLLSSGWASGWDVTSGEANGVRKETSQGCQQ